MAYITKGQLKDYASNLPRDTVTPIELVLDQVIATASQAVDDYCHRHFAPAVDNAGAPVLTPRLFKAWHPYSLEVDDIANRSTVTVAIDTDGQGTFGTTWTTSQYYLEPLNAEAWGEPVTLIRPAFALFPVLWNARPLIRVTAQWGWPAVPEPVKSATFMVALDLLKMKDAPFGMPSFGDYGPVRARANAKVAELLDNRYVRSQVGIA